MPEKIITVDNLLQELELVICDTSMVFRSNDWGWYQDSVYSKRSFSGMNPDSMAKEIGNLKYFLSLLESPNIATVPGVSAEIRRERNMVTDTIRFLNQLEDLVSNKFRKKLGKQGFRKRETGRELLEEIRDLIHQCYLQSRRISFLPKDKLKYEMLEKKVIEIAAKTGSKIDFSQDYLKRIKPKNVEDFHTDEQLVAAAIYSFAYDDKDVGILTRDSDIRRIMRKTVSCGNLSDVLRFSENGSRRLRIYGFSFQEELRCDFDSLN